LERKLIKEQVLQASVNMLKFILISLFLTIHTSTGQFFAGIDGGIDGGLRNVDGQDYQVVLVRRPQPQIAPAIVRQPIAIRAQPIPQPIQVIRPQPLIRPAYEDYGPPQPYSFGYQSAGDDGTTSSRQESSDGTRVTGSYSYQDAQGLYRTVEYVADENGFRATIRTNEPGTANESPADVQLTAEAPPPGVVEQWLRPQARPLGRIIRRA
jgi:hypothetical protein